MSVIGGSGPRILESFDKNVKTFGKGHDAGVSTYTGLVGWLAQFVGLAEKVKVGHVTFVVGKASAQKYFFRHGGNHQASEWGKLDVEKAIHKVVEDIKHEQPIKIAKIAKHEHVVETLDFAMLEAFAKEMGKYGIKISEENLGKFKHRSPGSVLPGAVLKSKLFGQKPRTIKFGRTQFTNLVQGADVKKVDLSQVSDPDKKAVYEGVVEFIKQHSRK